MAVLESTNVVVTIDTTVVLAGIPVPVTVWPAPISGFAAANVTVALAFVVVPEAVNTPI